MRRDLPGSTLTFDDGYPRAAETLLVHCYAGESRSRAVAAFAVKLLGGDNSEYFRTGHPNELVYETLERVWKSRTGSAGR